MGKAMATKLAILAIVVATNASGQPARPPGPASPSPTDAVTVRIRPDPVYVERAGEAQLLSFELELLNRTAAPLDLVLVRMRAYDETGQLLAWEKLDSNGSRPSIETLGQRRLEPGKPLTVFNPFFRLDTAAPVATLRYQLSFVAPGLRREATVEAHPVEYRQQAHLILPVAGARLWAYEGSGFFSHHRRVDLTNPFNRDILGMKRNAQRYALDLVVVDAAGEAYHGDPGAKESWVGYGFPVVAPAPGTVVAATDTLPNDIPEDESLLAKNPGLMAGNFVVIAHGNGEYSALAHFQQGSLAVKTGDRVERGQLLGKMGRSGMGSQLVHVHYQLQSGPEMNDADALPMRFEGFRRAGSPAAGATGQGAPGWIAPGWVVVTAPVARPGPPAHPPAEAGAGAGSGSQGQ
jgi:hypothetical protein